MESDRAAVFGAVRRIRGSREAIFDVVDEAKAVYR